MASIPAFRIEVVISEKFIDHALSVRLLQPILYRRSSSGPKLSEKPIRRGRKKSTATVRDKTDFTECLDKGGALFSHHDIAGEGYIGAGAGSHAIHCGDHGFFNSPYPFYNRVIMSVYNGTEFRSVGVYCFCEVFGLRRMLSLRRSDIWRALRRPACICPAPVVKPVPFPG